jgi:hypothetical protein
MSPLLLPVFLSSFKLYYRGSQAGLSAACTMAAHLLRAVAQGLNASVAYQPSGWPPFARLSWL